MRCYLGPEWVPNHIEVSHRSGARGRELEDHFGVPVWSDRTAVAIVFNKGLLGAAQIQRTTLPAAVTRADVCARVRRFRPISLVRQRMSFTSVC